MKNIITLMMFGCLICTTWSCADYLTEKSESGFTAATLFDTPQGLEKMVIALYPYERGLTHAGNTNGFLAAQLWGERNTDIVIFCTGDDANLCRYTSPGPTSNISGLIYEPYWKARYYLIGRTNEIITYGQQFGDASKATVAEASFWRAYCYYGLWSRFSRCYLSTEPVTQGNINSLIYAPADSSSVFKLMYQDLDRAIQGLPIQVPTANKGRIGRETARHQKALVAAWAKDWQEVANQVDSIVIESPAAGLSFITDPATIFNRSDIVNGSETLFSLIFSNERGGVDVASSGTSGGHRLGSQFVNTIADNSLTSQVINGVTVQYNLENLGRQWGLAYPNSYLMSLYPKGDKRIKAYYKVYYTYQNPNNLPTIPVSTNAVFNGVTVNSSTNFTGSPRKVVIGDTIFGRDVKAAKLAALDRRAYFPSSLKLVDVLTKPLDADGSFLSYKDILIYRLSESYLLGAEAYYHLGNQTKTREYYNKTWTRAGNPAITTDITFDMIRDEQARELAFEGRRWDFLKRNGIWYDQMRSFAGDFTVMPTATNVPGYNAATYAVSDGRDPKSKPNPAWFYDFSGSANDAFVRFNVQPIHVNWPIPQSQIDAMGPSFPQNPGY